MLSRCVKLFETKVKGREFTAMPLVKNGIYDSAAVTFSDEVRSGKRRKVITDDKNKNVLNHGDAVDYSEEYQNEHGKIKSKRKARPPPTKYGSTDITIEHHLDTADAHHDIFEKEEVNKKVGNFCEKGYKAIDDFN
eukprot:14784745-Ditylum_brightwellii.AAC.1